MQKTSRAYVKILHFNSQEETSKESFKSARRENVDRGDSF